VRLPPDFHEGVSIRVIDITGRSVFTKQFLIGEHPTIHSELPPGTYIIQIASKGSSLSTQSLIIK